MIKKVNILGKDYKVIRKLPEDLKKAGYSEDSFMGLCMDDRGLLYINKAYKDGEHYWATLLHEVGHAVMYRNGIRNSGAVSMEMEEIIVETMANVYYPLIKQIIKGIVKSGKATTISSLVEKL